MQADTGLSGLSGIVKSGGNGGGTGTNCDCVHCTNSIAANEWTVNLSGFTGDFANFAGIFSLTYSQGGTPGIDGNGCGWNYLEDDNSIYIQFIMFNNFCSFLIQNLLTAKWLIYESSSFNGNTPNCFTSKIVNRYSYTGTGNSPSTLTVVPVLA
jgi:hypothetical protein